MPLSRAVGIDLGASRTAVARIDELGRSTLLRDPQGDLLIPSVVFFEDEDVIHGRAANLAAAMQPSRAAEFYKRDLGQSAYSRAIGGELLPAELVEAYLLRKLVGDLAADGLPNPAAVLALPASFNQAQRRARIDAARVAGLEVLGMIHDPVAAALAFADSQGYFGEGAASKPGQRVLVVDLGGSKLDVAIVEMKPGRLRTMAVGGTMDLGGRDFDALLAEYLAEQFAKQFGDDPRHDMMSVRRLLERAAEAKHSLSARQQTRVQVQRGEDAAAIIVTRHAFDELAAGLLDQIAATVESTMSRSGMAWRDVAHLLLVGGGTRMPAVAERLAKLSSLEPAAGVHADEAVARGAALYAASLLALRQRETKTTQIALVGMTTHSLGLEWNDPQSKRLENVVLIPRGTELPCGTVAKVVTDVEDQSEITVHLLEGESRVAEECARIAVLSIRELPSGLPQGTQIDVHYHFTVDGRLQVKAQMPKSGQALPISVRREKSMSEAQLAEWKAVVARGGGLKLIHPLLRKQQQEREVQEAAARAAAPVMPAVQPPALPPQMPAGGQEFLVQGASDGGMSARIRKRRLTPRKLAIMIGGYLISALVGTAIGYYILMRIDPSYNWWHLRLPGLRDAPPSSTRPVEAGDRYLAATFPRGVFPPADHDAHKPTACP